MAMTTISLHLDEEIKTRAEKAATLLGMSLAEYVTRLLDEDADCVISRHDAISVEGDLFDRFLIACEQARQPNAPLRDAARFTRQQEIS